MPNTVTTFSFYLDAALFCKRAGLPLTQILRADWRTWIVLPVAY